MIYLKLRQAGERVNHKRVQRLYAQAGLQLRKRKRQKVPQADRCPLGRPSAANQVWSMDFVFDRTAEGRSIKSLTGNALWIMWQRPRKRRCFPYLSELRNTMHTSSNQSRRQINEFLASVLPYMRRSGEIRS